MSIQNTIDEKWMRVALSLSRRNKGATWPNPHVGCLIVKDEQVIGRGWTAKSGRPHAETQALLQAGENANGSTAYVTLEPCAHIGHTKPCSEALINAKVKRVVISTRDLDPRVSGTGITMLENAGIQITEGVMEADSCYEHSGFFNRIVTGRPQITLKLASSLDGHIANENNESKWITSIKSRKLTHLYRMYSDAVMIGAGTAELDDPALDVRHIKTNQQPARIIIDSNLRTSFKSKIFKSMSHFKTFVCCLQNVKPNVVKKWESNGAKIIKCKNTSDGKVNLKDALSKLGSLGFNNIFCEGGSTLATNLIYNNLVEELILIKSGLLIGENGKSLVGKFPETPFLELPKLNLIETYQYGGDSVSIWSKTK